MNGILLVDKPADWTSHDVVAKLRGVLGERRMGHSGTLDPMATGLLVVFAGRATRAVSFSENHSKCYEARLRLGLTTDTQDTTGTVLSRCDRRVTRAELEAVLPQFRLSPGFRGRDSSTRSPHYHLGDGRRQFYLRGPPQVPTS